MKKSDREKVHKKYDGRCSYCGREIKYIEMQIDHLVPRCRKHFIEDVNAFSNLMPSCRRCNHYKRAESLDNFRRSMKTIHERIKQIYICKVGFDFGILEVKPFNGGFYFERINK